jgi:uncharacterized membrane protein YhaH (DUF805 family)
MEWYSMAWKRYADFSGRSARMEFWVFALYNFIFCVLLYSCGSTLMGNGVTAYFFLGLTGIYGLAVLVPSLACAVRRLHDTGKSGWWLLIGLIPVAGFALIVLLALDSEPGENIYGPNPKLAVGAAAIG